MPSSVDTSIEARGESREGMRSIYHDFVKTEPSEAQYETATCVETAFPDELYHILHFVPFMRA